VAQCEICPNEVVQGRGRARRTCSAACRQKAHRRRQAEQVAELRAAVTRPALTLVPPTAQTAAPAPDDSPAGLIRAAGAELADAIEYAARRAAEKWAPPGNTARMMTAAVEYDVDKVLAAIRASAPEASRNEPEPSAVTAPTTTPAGLSRDEPAASVPAPVAPEAPAADTEPSRNNPPAKKAPARKRLSQKAARAAADSAQLVKDPGHRENHRWNLVADDETVLGHIEPSYGGTGRTGRNGWKYRGADTFRVGGGPYKTRDEAAVQCALSWMRLVTAPVRRTPTGA
jgi:hypothetical protein